MAQQDEQLADYVVEYRISLLPDVKDEDFRPRRALNDAGFSLTQAHFGSFELEHRFLKRIRSEDDPDQYVWQIRISNGMMTVNATEDNVLARLHDEVTRTLAPVGIPVSRTVMKEINATETG